jgi:hypothetical protein
MSNSLAQQWKQTEKPIEPLTGPVGYPAGTQGSGYAARLAVGPGPSASIYGYGGLGMDYGGSFFSNQFQPVPSTLYVNGSPATPYPPPYSTTQFPLNVTTMSNGWTYNLPYRQCEINVSPGAQAVLTCTMDGGAPALTIGEKIEIWLVGFMQSGTVTVLQGGVATGSNISAATWNAAVASPPGLGIFRISITAVAAGNTITLQFPAAALAQMQIKALTIVRDYSDWNDYAQNLALMNP